MDISFKTIEGFESNAQALILKYLEKHMESIALVGFSLTVNNELLNISDLPSGTTMNVSLIAQKLISLVPIVNSEAFSEPISDSKIFTSEISFSNKSNIRTSDLITESGVPYFVNIPDVCLVEFAESLSFKIHLHFKKINRNYSAQEISAELEPRELQYVTYFGAQSAPPVTSLSAKDGYVSITLPLPESERENIQNMVKKLQSDIFQFS